MAYALMPTLVYFAAVCVGTVAHALLRAALALMPTLVYFAAVCVGAAASSLKNFSSAALNTSGA
jgi:hypothetical protein